ncbi:MarR family winged helix-turn-helix transcriptional regulator [Pedomonas mirosovicensis]|uniref:MarR family winged helix-turn-helix transcriptional regulator n=1 Tax=Pedomonas mirosovicensis TaxID=2908641 RepID=UPI002169C2C7|nr:MarR family transcriptional regulator [Pedomonas mirosovicensis]MCH8685450.1 MarR family transcriptional regulator [Pedomonas mirosovicensis]
MADANSLASPLFLREAELRRGIELLYFGYRDFTKGPDALLEKHGFGRAHHRALYFIGRRPGLSVSELLKLLCITKQSLSRVLSDLQNKGYVVSSVGHHDKRQRLLYLTETGAELERETFAAIRDRMAQAYGQAGPQAVAGFWAVLMGLIEADQQATVQDLMR